MPLITGLFLVLKECLGESDFNPKVDMSEMINKGNPFP